MDPIRPEQFHTHLHDRPISKTAGPGASAAIAHVLGGNMTTRDRAVSPVG